MSRKKITLILKGSGILVKPIFAIVLTPILISLLSACAVPATTTQAQTSSAPAITAQAPASIASTTNTVEAAKPQGELVVAFTEFGNENYLPWKSSGGASQINCLIYDMLIYFDEVNRKFIPGLAESWETSPDAMTLTYNLRKGVQFSDGWGELTSEDVKFNFEMHATPKSVGKTSQARSIASMETPDPYTLILHFKTPQPIFFAVFSLGNGGICQGVACKKYVETVGEEVASQKPIGTGPYKLVESKLGESYKFEALDSHWRVVPEFKYVTLRIAPEISTTVAMLKNKEIDLAGVPAEQLDGLKAVGLATEVTTYGGGVLDSVWGGICLPEDSRYNPDYHNKDPWVDMRVRKAMTISIDRQAICNKIFAGGAHPVGVPLFSANMDKYQYPYDPAAAKQLLIEAGYPNGFTFKLISYTMQGVPEMPRLIEALAGYWQQIGLDPQIITSDYGRYVAIRMQLKIAGEVSVQQLAPTADMLERASLFLIPGSPATFFMDDESYAIYKEGNAKVKFEERAAYVDKLNQYYYENYGPIPIVNISGTFAWNPVLISPWPHTSSAAPYYLEYVRHAQPLNTFRLFTPWPGR